MKNLISSSALVIVFALALRAAHAGEPKSLVEPGAKVKKLADGMKFTEGPVWLPAQKTLVFSDIPNSKLMQWKEGEGLSVFRKSEQANGNILDLEGRLISCQHAARNLVRTLKVDVKGNLYTTDAGVNIYDADGKLLEKIDVPMGPANICFGGDDYKTLFITARTSLYSVRLVNAGAKPPGAKW